ncbi:MAG: DinB family protein [Planctomyces sp.]
MKDLSRWLTSLSATVDNSPSVPGKLFPEYQKGISLPMSPETLLQNYIAGPQQLKAALMNVREEQLDLHPIAGKWSIREVVCHLADFELVYADRIKRVLAEDNPTLFSGDPNCFASALAYRHRQISDELQMIESIRRQVAVILQKTDVENWQRTGVHSEAGPLTLETLLERVTHHIHHHIPFIEEKLRAMG